MFTKEQIAEIIREETAAVLAEQQIEEGALDTLKRSVSRVSGDIKKYATDVMKDARTASIVADLKKQIEIEKKQKAENDKVMASFAERARKLGVSLEVIVSAANAGAVPIELGSPKKASGAEPTAAPPVVGEPESPKE